MTAWDAEADLLVFGSGAAGLSAALVGAIEGLDVRLFEKSSQFGGTTATSGGAIWVVAPTLGLKAGYPDTVASGRQYLRHELGAHYRSDLAEAFLAHGAVAVDYLNENSDVAFGLFPIPDYHADAPGGVAIGRTLYTLEFDGRRLGKDFKRLRPPMKRLMVLGGLMINKDEIPLLIHPFQSSKAIRLALRLLTRYALDRLRHPRGTRLLIGNALVGRFLFSLRRRRVPLTENAQLVRLLHDGDGVGGAVVNINGCERQIRARRGVVLATGGPAHDIASREEFMGDFPHELSIAFEGNTGDAFRAGRAIGAAVDTDLASPAVWTPASVHTESDGSQYLSPYGYLDRGKPGAIAVDRHGRRFCNEANSYQDVVLAMYANHDGPRPVSGHLVFDADFLWKYGMGIIAPNTRAVGRWVRDGYLHRAATLHELARQLSLDESELLRSISRHNEFARSGKDTDFGKGDSTFNRHNGDPTVEPNPCLAPIAQAPFYALPIRPATLGMSLGLKTNGHAQVLDQIGEPIRGLYACGGDMGSVMRGWCPAGGVTLGPAIVFGYIAARHAAGAQQDRKIKQEEKAHA